MPDLVHHLEKLIPEGDERIYRITFSDGDVFRLRQLQPSSHSFDTGIAEWLAEIVEVVTSGRLREGSSFTPGEFLELAESDIIEVVDEETGKTLFTRSDATPTI